MSARLSDLAGRLGLNASTVSRALRNDPRVKEATRRLVQRAAAEAGYRPNLAARTLAEGKSRTVWFIIPGLEHPVDREPAEAAGPKFLERGYDLLLAQHHRDLAVYRRVLGRIAAGGADGAIVIPHPQSDGVAEDTLSARGIPLVFLDRGIEGSGISVVTTDNAAATKALLEAAAEAAQGAGMTPVLVVDGFTAENDVERKRSAATEEFALRHGLTVVRGDADAWRPETSTEAAAELRGTGIALIAASGERRAARLAQDLTEKQAAFGGAAETATGFSGRIFIGVFDAWTGPAEMYGGVFVAAQDFTAMAERAAELIVDALEGGESVPRGETFSIPMIGINRRS